MGVGPPDFRSHLLVLQEFVHIVLNVAEINDALVQLILRELLVPFFCQPEDGLYVLLLKVIYLLTFP